MHLGWLYRSYQSLWVSWMAALSRVFFWKIQATVMTCYDDTWSRKDGVWWYKGIWVVCIYVYIYVYIPRVISRELLEWTWTECLYIIIHQVNHSFKGFSRYHHEVHGIMNCTLIFEFTHVWRWQSYFLESWHDLSRWVNVPHFFSEVHCLSSSADDGRGIFWAPACPQVDHLSIVPRSYPTSSNFWSSIGGVKKKLFV